jgi:hypothetical protein
VTPCPPFCGIACLPVQAGYFGRMIDVIGFDAGQNSLAILSAVGAA